MALGNLTIMSGQSIRDVIAKHGPPPGLAPWRKEQVLLLRCRDITTEQFRERVLAKIEETEALSEEAQPGSVDSEQYQIAGNYYPVVAQCLAQYLEGLEELLYWSESGDEKALENSLLHIETGDRLSQEVMVLIFELQEQFRQTDEALMGSMGISPEGKA